MNVLAIDTATERCSVVLRTAGTVIERSVETPRGHAELVLPMVEAVLGEAGLALTALDGIAYGRGPGAFTGVRIAVSVVQGLAFGARLPTVGVSDLAAVAQQAARPGERALVCMDARMGEVYWGVFEVESVTGLATLLGEEQVSDPARVPAREDVSVVAGSGLEAYPQLSARFPAARHVGGALPHAREVALLGEALLAAGQGVPAAQARPVYLRDKVTFVAPARGA